MQLDTHCVKWLTPATVVETATISPRLVSNPESISSNSFAHPLTSVAMRLEAPAWRLTGLGTEVSEIRDVEEEKL